MAPTRPYRAERTKYRHMPKAPEELMVGALLTTLEMTDMGATQTGPRTLEVRAPDGNTFKVTVQLQEAKPQKSGRPMTSEIESRMKALGGR